MANQRIEQDFMLAAPLCFAGNTRRLILIVANSWCWLIGVKEMANELSSKLIIGIAAAVVLLVVSLS